MLKLQKYRSKETRLTSSEWEVRGRTFRLWRRCDKPGPWQNKVRRKCAFCPLREELRQTHLPTSLRTRRAMFEGLRRLMLINIDPSCERSGGQAVHICSKPSVFSLWKIRFRGKIRWLFSSTCRAILLGFTLIIRRWNDVGVDTGTLSTRSRFPSWHRHGLLRHTGP